MAERPRHDGWSLRSALVRFAQLDPTGASATLEVVRRVDRALAEHRRVIERGDAVPEAAVPVLAVAAGLDELADELAAWAVRRSLPPPEIAPAVTRLYRALDEIGVPREDRPPRRAGTRPTPQD